MVGNWVMAALLFNLILKGMISYMQARVISYNHLNHLEIWVFEVWVRDRARVRLPSNRLQMHIHITHTHTNTHAHTCTHAHTHSPMLAGRVSVSSAQIWFPWRGERYKKAEPRLSP